MKKALRSLLALVLVFVVILSMSPSVSAANCKTKKYLKHATYGAIKTVVYVTSKDTKTATLNYKSSHGALTKSDGWLGRQCDYVEVRVFGKSGNSWKEISKKNIKGITSDTISMKGYKEYKVEFWVWNVRTTGSHIGGKYNWSDIYWAAYPETYVYAKTNNITKIS